MDITFLGHSSFRLKGKTATVVTDPFDPEVVGLKFPKVTADIVTVSHQHEDHNQADLVKGVKRLVSGPGEYEIMGVSIIGIPTFHDEKKGAKRGKNTIYVYEMDGLRLVHLGDLGHKLHEKILEKIGDIDILMVPVGGEYTIGPTEAVEVARAIEPKMVIPMHYQMPGLNPATFAKLSSTKPFLAEIGLLVEKTDKLSVKKENIGEESKVILLEKKN
jgi:L-ascorbate metabolism protein UlaG (beta-lactamase superfamily)